ncbi:hypothetical protein PCASD_14220 [Puccinia coronata f. sp. avenae]|uniref:SUN domain-containing protein n=1 Tax=Puccinia coronata f. sp. avenae TaxID=200324 RepID=A0A2N5TP24_9BASI|nr:hypothetical protein PCASD_14220 [Puccinia coronata f. sp. avenae]
MPTTQSNRLQHTSHEATGTLTNPQSVGTFGRKAAIRWKYLKQKWFSILVILIGSTVLITIARKQSSLRDKVVLLDQRLQDLQEQSLKMNEKIDSLVVSYNDMVRRSEFEEGLFQLKNFSKTMSTPENQDYEFPANKEGDGLSIYSKKDFALFSAGATIVEHLTSPTWSYHRQIRQSNFPFSKKTQKIFGSPPLTILVSDLSLGTCWPFHGTTGQITIQLSRIIQVKGITIGHVSRSLAYDIRTAPKNFELWGVDDNGHEFRGSLLLDGTYEIDGVDNLQEFSVATMKSQLYSQSSTSFLYLSSLVSTHPSLGGYAFSNAASCRASGIVALPGEIASSNPKAASGSGAKEVQRSMAMVTERNGLIAR